MAELLRVEALSAGYGEARVISNLDLSLDAPKRKVVRVEASGPYCAGP